MTDTAARKTVLLPQQGACKAQEIEFMEAMVAHFSTKDLYLRGLFSNQLLEWFRMNAQNDWTADVMEALQASDKAVRKAEEKVRQLEAAQMNHVECEKKLENIITQLREDRTAKMAEVSNAEARAAKYAAEADGLKEIMDTRVQAYELQAEAMRMEIIKLKARLFDLMA